MKVLHVFKTYWPDSFGGVERSIHAIARGAQPYGVQSEVLSLSRRPEAASVMFDGHMAWKARLDFEFASTGFSRAVFKRFRALSRQADLIHYHFPWPLMDVLHIATRCRKPAVVTYHSDIVKQKSLMRLYRPLMTRFLNGMDRVVATSPDYLASSPVLRGLSAPVVTIPLGLDEADYPPPRPERLAYWRARLLRPFFLFVGVLRYYKGAHVLVEATRLGGFSTVIVGDGPMGPELKARAGWRGEGGQGEGVQEEGGVIFTGALADEDKIALLNLCQGFVFPSHLRSEAFGLSLVEAAMAAKPMISCKIGTGTSYVNLDGVTGFTIAPENPRELADAMGKLAGDVRLRVGLGQNARQRYEENFTARKMASAYADLYREVLSGRA